VIDNERPGDQKPNIHTLCVVTHRPRWARHSKVRIGKLLGGVNRGESGVRIAAIPRVSSCLKSPSERSPYHGRYSQDGSCHRVSRRSPAIAVFWWRNDHRDDEWRDDGEMKRGGNQLAMALRFACCRFNPERKTTMKTPILVAGIIACVVSVPIVSAQDKPVSAKPATSMDMDKQMSQMQQNMKTMQVQMEKLRTTTDPNERQKLMQEHMQSMQENMKTMRNMGGPMMMAMGRQKDMAGGEMMQHQAMMEKRMDMMQMMMEQMLQHDQAMAPLLAK